MLHDPTHDRQNAAKTRYICDRGSCGVLRRAASCRSSRSVFCVNVSTRCALFERCEFPPRSCPFPGAALPAAGPGLCPLRAAAPHNGAGRGACLEGRGGETPSPSEGARRRGGGAPPRSVSRVPDYGGTLRRVRSRQRPGVPG